MVQFFMRNLDAKISGKFDNFGQDSISIREISDYKTLSSVILWNFSMIDILYIDGH